MCAKSHQVPNKNSDSSVSKEFFSKKPYKNDCFTKQNVNLVKNYTFC